MATEEWQTYCPSCARVVLGRREKPSHTLHFLIAFFTCGLWVIPWFILTQAAKSKAFRCPICGSEGVNSSVLDRVADSLKRRP